MHSFLIVSSARGLAAGQQAAAIKMRLGVASCLACPVIHGPGRVRVSETERLVDSTIVGVGRLGERMALIHPTTTSFRRLGLLSALICLCCPYTIETVHGTQVLLVRGFQN